MNPILKGDGGNLGNRDGASGSTIWMGQGFYVDVDYEMKDTTMAAEMTAKVIRWYRDNVDRYPNLTIVSSGGKGFHVIDFNFVHEVHLKGQLLKGWQGAYDKKYEKKGLTPMAVRQNISRNFKRMLVEEMKRDGLLVDFEVTPDPRRNHSPSGYCTW